MLLSDTSPDVNTSEIWCLKRSTIAVLRKAIILDCYTWAFIAAPADKFHLRKTQWMLHVIELVVLAVFGAVYLRPVSVGTHTGISVTQST